MHAFGREFKFTQVLLKPSELASTKRRGHKPKHLLDGLVLRIQARNQMFYVHCDGADVGVSVDHGFHYCAVFCLNEYAVVAYAASG